ncbi:MAG: hypothetical protein ABI689_11850 [Thermoanaerobaculia bacterium]
MNRLAACAFVAICISLSACKSAAVPPPAPPPPPAPAPATAYPPGCVERPGSPVPMSVNKLASVPTADECIVLDKGAVVKWQGDADVKTLLVGWKPKSTGCDQPPSKNPVCKGNSCSFDTAQVATTVNLTLCYGVGAIDINNTSSIKDPRLIIRR